jgi:predicted RecA/RadA family phage recombinase
MSYKVQEGGVVDFTLSSTVTAGDLVAVGNCVGVALSSGESGDVIAVALEGVWDLPKADAAVIALHEQVAFDVSAGRIDDVNITPATGDITLCGIAMEAAGATTDARIKVRLNPGGGTIN